MEVDSVRGGVVRQLRKIEKGSSQPCEDVCYSFSNLTLNLAFKFFV